MVPKVSVITAVYNGLPYVEDTARSVLEQRDIDVEWVIVDDASTDGSVEALTALVADYQYEGMPVRIIRHDSNVGLSNGYINGIWHVYSEGVSETSAPFFKILDHDDVLAHPFVLRDQVQFLAEHPQAAVSFGRSIHIDRNGKQLRNAGWFLSGDQGIVDKRAVALNHLFHLRYPFTHASMLYNRDVVTSVWKRSGRVVFDNALLIDVFDSDYEIGYQDAEFAHFRRRKESYSNSHEGMTGQFDELQRDIASWLLGRRLQESPVIFRHAVKGSQEIRDSVLRRSAEF